ncbi:MAG: ArsR/SmtB family transcription factor [Sulfitobacter sp.]
MTAQLNSSFACLADPTRRAVVERLASGPATVSELAAPHKIALPTFMRHLKVLERSGLVRSVKKGRVRTCQIEEAPLLELRGWLEWQRKLWERRIDGLAPPAQHCGQNQRSTAT